MCSHKTKTKFIEFLYFDNKKQKTLECYQREFLLIKIKRYFRIPTLLTFK